MDKTTRPQGRPYTDADGIEHAVTVDHDRAERIAEAIAEQTSTTITEAEILGMIEAVAPGTHAYCEQTGGGVATIFVGEPRTPKMDTERDEAYLLAIGPGWFAALDGGTFEFGDLYLGPDDGAGEFYTTTINTRDALRVALTEWLTQTPDWRDIDGSTVAARVDDTRCPKCGLFTTGLRYESNGGTWHRRCEDCDVQECGDCRQWVQYLDEQWSHVQNVECFLAGPGPATILIDPIEGLYCTVHGGDHIVVDAEPQQAVARCDTEQCSATRVTRAEAVAR